MAVTTASRPSHYEILGISPTAAGDDIARAFAREGSVFRPHAFGALTELCIAYETLRDPIKRRAYDASLGLDRKAVPQNRSIGARQVRLPMAPTAAPVPQVAMKVPPDSPAIGQVARPALSRGSDPKVVRSYNPDIMLAENLVVEARPLDLKRPAIAAATIVAAACALGGLVGYWSSRDVAGTTQTAKPVSVSLPAPDRHATPTAAEAPTAPVVSVADTPHPRAQHVVARVAPIEPGNPDPEPVEADEAALQSTADPTPLDQTASEEPVTPTPANLPLSNRVIARTIERIGYSCGSVTSAVAVEGEAPGIYKIICSSGQSYKAGPVNGRYRFRRWGKS